ncbi:hypothetical protein MMC29_005434 [Sticta canariensis]|nr:hypothetical protein [Sticta canariensis]
MGETRMTLDSCKGSFLPDVFAGLSFDVVEHGDCVRDCVRDWIGGEVVPTPFNAAFHVGAVARAMTADGRNQHNRKKKVATGTSLSYIQEPPPLAPLALVLAKEITGGVITWRFNATPKVWVGRILVGRNSVSADFQAKEKPV